MISRNGSYQLMSDDSYLDSQLLRHVSGEVNELDASIFLRYNLSSSKVLFAGRR